MSVTEIQTMIAATAIIGSGVSAYVGVKVALVKMQTEIQSIKERTERLESKVFK